MTRPPIPTFDPLDVPPPATEGDRRELRRRIRAAWPELADVLARSPGRRLSTETLALISREITRTPQE